MVPKLIVICDSVILFSIVIQSEAKNLDDIHFSTALCYRDSSSLRSSE